MNMAIPSKRIIEIHWSKYIQRNCMKIKWQKLLHWQSNLLKNFTSMHEVFTNSQRSVLILIFCCDHYQKYIHLLHLCPLCNEMDCNNLSDSSSKELLFSFLLSRLCALSSTTCLHFHILIYSKYDIPKYILCFHWLNAPFMNTRLVMMSVSLCTQTVLRCLIIQVLIQESDS